MFKCSKLNLYSDGWFSIFEKRIETIREFWKGLVSVKKEIITQERIKNFFTIDVEDWYHIVDEFSMPKIEQWDSLPTIVEKDFLYLLDILDEYNTKATCFFLGYIARRFPHLVKIAKERGHEICSHGFYHQVVYSQTREEFYDDVSSSKKLLEDISGDYVFGYRAPSFSVIETTPWFFEVLIDAGYRYDSSVFPAKREHGGLKADLFEPFFIRTSNGVLLEIPISISRFLFLQTCFFGGGYLRFFPMWLINHMVKKVNAELRPVVFYVHPREIDPVQPKLKSSLKRRFKAYVNLRTTEKKIREILSKNYFQRMSDFYKETIGKRNGKK